MRLQVVFTLFIVFLLAACSDVKQTERVLEHFLDRHVDRIKPINQKYSEVVWATYTGQTSFTSLLERSRMTDSLYRAAGEPVEYYQNLLNNVYDNSSDFEILMKIKASGLIQDPLLKRQFMKVFRQYLSIQNSWDESESKQAELFEQFFDLKKSETAFWDSVQQVPGVDARNEWIEQFSELTVDFKEMIQAMNRDAQKMGYANYFQLVMDFNGVDYQQLDEFTKIIEQETAADYRQLLEACNTEINRSFNIPASQITPQHYKYEAKKMMLPEAWDKDYTREEFVDILNRYFAYGAYNTESIIQNSDLWFAPDKINQSFFFSVDAEKSDYRIYANIKTNTMGVYTMLHEFGHAVHYQEVDKKLPYLLCEPHTIATEAVAIYFNDKLYHSNTLRRLMALPDISESAYFSEFVDPSRLVFLRKLLRSIAFQQQIFENPEQDFNELWWSLNEKYLYYQTDNDKRLPEWISNQHIIYANGVHVFYLFATAVAAQLEAYFPNDVIGPVKGFMRLGDSMEWSDMLEQVTGEPLNLNYLFNSYRRISKEEVPFTFNVVSGKMLSYYEENINQTTNPVNSVT